MREKALHMEGGFFRSFTVYPVDTGRKLNVHKTFRKRPGRLLNVLCTFSLRPVFTGKGIVQFLFFMSFFLALKKRRRLGRRLNTRL